MNQIRQLELDIDKGILKINGKEVKRPTVVQTTGVDGWPLEKMISGQSIREECPVLSVNYVLPQ